MRTLDELRIHLARRFPISERCDEKSTLPFVTLCSGGLKDQKAPYPTLCADEETAIRLWVEAFGRHLSLVVNSGQGPMVIADGSPVVPPLRQVNLLWRVEPELREFHMTIADYPAQRQREAGRWCTVYARLLLAHKTALEAESPA